MTSNQFTPYEPYSYTPQPLSDAEVMAYAGVRESARKWQAVSAGLSAMAYATPAQEPAPMDAGTRARLESAVQAEIDTYRKETPMTEDFEPVTAEEFTASLPEAEAPPVTDSPAEDASEAPEGDSGDNPNREAAKYRTRLREAEARIAEMESTRAMTEALTGVLPRSRANDVGAVMEALPADMTPDAAASLVKLIGEMSRPPMDTTPIEDLHSGASGRLGDLHSNASEIERHMW